MQTDPITRLFTHAAALRSLASRQDETEAGLSLILRLLADDIEECGDALESAEQPCPTLCDSTPAPLPGLHPDDDEVDAPHD